MRLKNFVLLNLLFCVPFLQAQSISYTLNIENPKQHLASVQMTIPVMQQDSITLALPAWAPGRYVIYNFSKNIFGLQAENEFGKPLAIKILDKQSWMIYCPGSDTVKVRYRLFANTLDGSFSKIDSSGASINGSGVFMYLVDGKDKSVKLKIQTPDGWQIISALESNSNGNFYAANYDRLIDSPIEMGNLAVYSFHHLDKVHRLVFHQKINKSFINTFIKDLKKIITQLANVFDGQLPYQRYVFFFHLNPNLKHTDGMEHLNSCRVLLHMNPNNIKPDANTNPDYDNLIWLSAHEYFHLWNVKRLRPAGLGPFDYSKEVYTKSLWLVEGVTSYYAYLSLIRSDIYTQDKILSEFSGRINRYEGDPGKTQRTLEEVSQLTWLFKGNIPEYEQTNIDATTYSYYYKGLIVGLLLDLKIRSETNNQKSLDDVMQATYRTFYSGQQERYYLPGSGYSEQQFEALAEKVSGLNLDAFFDTALRSTNELDYSILNAAGLTLERQADGKLKLKRLPQPSPAQDFILNGWLNK